MSQVELLGYTASFFVVMSLLMGDIQRLRYINLLGCVLFVIYGIFITAYPVAVMNAVAAVINIYHLWRLHRKVS